MNALDWIDRAFVLLRLGGRRFVLAGCLGSAPLALACVFAFYLERVEGVRNARGMLAAAIALAWLFRGYTHARSGERLLELLGGGHSSLRALDAVRVASVAGVLLVIALLPTAGLARLGGAGAVFGLGFAVPLGVLAPAWSVIATEATEGTPTWTSAARAGAGLRGSALLLHTCLFVGTLLLFVNVLAVVGMLLGALQGLIGLEVSAIGAFMSFDNDFALLATAAFVLLLQEPLRVALSVVALLHARARRDGADLRRTLAALGAAGPTSPRPGARAAALLLLLGLSLALPPPAVAQDVATPAQPLSTRDSSPFDATPEDQLSEPELGAGSALVHPPAGDPAPGSVTVQESDPYGPSLSPADEATEDELVRILSGSEFREFEDAPMADGPEGHFNWLTRLLEALERWLRSLRASPTEGGDASNPMPVPPTWVFVALAATLLLAVIAFLVVSWRRERSALSELASPLGASDDPRERAPGDHLDDAARLAAGGQYRLAFRALYLATLVALDRSGEIDFDPARTNWHYLRRMGQGPRADAFRTFTSLFDRKWYGDEPTSAQEYERGRALATELTSTPPRDERSAAPVEEVA